MKTTTIAYCKMILLALASVALLTPAVHAQTISTSLDDLILGFYATGAPGQTLNLEVDLGNMSNFYNPTGSIPLPALAVQDLVDTYGASWSTRTDLFWGAVSTTGRAAGTADGHAPVGTLWATAPVGQTAFNRGSAFAQKAASPNIEAMVDAGAAGSLLGATSTSNSADAAVINAALPGSWTAQDLKTSGTSFGYFNPTVDNTANIPSGGQVASDLYELQPTNASGVAGTLLGELILTQSGLSFQAGGGIAPPVAGFSASPTNGAAPLLVTFTDASTGTITSRQWTFGDGGTSSTTSPSYSYTNAGVFSVSLQVIGPGGSNTLNLVNLITVTNTNAPPTTPLLTIVSPTDFQTFASASLLVTGTAADAAGILSVTVNGTAATLSGTNWSEQVTLVLGTNALTVIATDNSANTATQIVHAVLVPVPPPIAGFTASPTNGAAPLLVVFTDASTGTITNRSWTFGDGGTSSAISPGHTYTNAGVFSVSLQVSGPGGSSTSNRFNLITVTNTNAPPAPPVLAIVSPTDFQTFTNASLVVTGTASDISGILSVTVNGTVATLSGTNWTEQVTLALGTNALNVIATDNTANTATQLVHAVLAPPPTNQAPVIVSAPAVTNALLSIQNVYVVAAGETNVFNVGAIDHSGLSLSYQWQFGDGVTNDESLFSTAQHAYAINNCGPVTATVTVSAGGASITSNVTVAVACQLAVSKVQAKLNFAKENTDGYSLTAVAQLSPDFLTAGQTLALDIGGAQETFTLDSKGRGVNEQGTCRLTFSKATKKRAAVWTVTIKLSHGAFGDAWAAYGLTDTTTNDASVNLPVVLTVGDEAFADDTTLLYTAKSGKSGTAK